ncbi:MAG: KamA family radical SAM protein [bacterium]|nr:KamA family radical SAM protein [bacterium]
MRFAINLKPGSTNGGRMDYHQCSLWKNVSSNDWYDWEWQLRNRIVRHNELSQIINLSPSEEAGVMAGHNRMPMAITPYFASLMDPVDPNCSIRRQVIPQQEELNISSYDLVDPCGEEKDSPVQGIVHRYPDRVLLLVTDRCAAYCRYCTRRRIVGAHEDIATGSKLDAAISYIEKNKKIRDCLISGGDPLLLPDDQLEAILTRLRKIPHLEMIRIGTRAPVTLPFRITEKLVSILKKFHPLYLSIHFTHPKEITPDVQKACNMLADAGIPLGSQTVLLKNINDKAQTMKKLLHELLKMRVRPYYLYQCDLAMGTEHFRTSVMTGVSIIEKLRGYTSGYAIPSFVIDAPGGGGKIPINPNYVLSNVKDKFVLRNFQNKIYEYYEPQAEQQVAVREKEGVLVG